MEESVVAIEAVVASSKEGGVQGRRSGRPVLPMMKKKNKKKEY